MMRFSCALLSAIFAGLTTVLAKVGVANSNLATAVTTMRTACFAAHVLLIEQYRYDMSWQQDPSGGTTTANYGASKGLETIP